MRFVLRATILALGHIRTHHISTQDSAFRLRSRTRKSRCAQTEVPKIWSENQGSVGALDGDGYVSDSAGVRLALPARRPRGDFRGLRNDQIPAKGSPCRFSEEPVWRVKLPCVFIALPPGVRYLGSDAQASGLRVGRTTFVCQMEIQRRVDLALDIYRRRERSDSPRNGRDDSSTSRRIR